MMLVKSFAIDADISFWKIKELLSVKVCCFVCPVGSVVNKSREQNVVVFQSTSS